MDNGYLDFRLDAEESKDENGLRKIALGGNPEQPRMRRMNQQESEAWSRGIHAASSPEWIPWLRFAYMHLMPFVDTECQTAYTDCHYRIGLSPDLLDPEKTSDAQLAFVIAHETMHNIQNHRLRFEKKNIPHLLMNFVTDLEINSMLAQGVARIDLSRKPAPNNSNGRWDWLLGRLEKLDAETAEMINGKYNIGSLVEGKHSTDMRYKEGDYLYQGGLLPRQAAFWDCPPGLSAEQYLELLDYDVYEQQEDFEFVYGSSDEQQQQGSNGNGGGGSSAGQQQQGDNLGGAGQKQQQQGNSASTGSGSGQQQQGYDANGGGNGPQQGNTHGSSTVTASGTKTVITQKHSDGSTTVIDESEQWDDIKSDDPELWEQVDELGIHPINRAEENVVREQVRHDISEYHQTNSYGSSHMDGLIKYVEKGLRPPVVDWRGMLRRIASRASQHTSAGKDDYSYRRRNRRYTSDEYIFPGLVSYVPTIRFAIDTSGSMSKQEYFNALSEAEGILRTTKAKFEVCCVDTKASEPKLVHSVKEITDDMVGGGGTDMSAAVKQVAEQKRNKQPNVLVIATDGFFDWNLLAESLADKRVKNLTVIVICVYKYKDDYYERQQLDAAENQKVLRAYKQQSYVINAWSNR